MFSPVDYVFVQSADPNDWPAPKGRMFQYLLAGNGLYVRAERSEMLVRLQWQGFVVKGLPELTSEVQLAGPRVPADFLLEHLDDARMNHPDREVLYLLSMTHRGWESSKPSQSASRFAVNAESDRVPLIDLHSHVEAAAVFSPTDDVDEQWFRIYAVLGNIFKSPELRVRIGVYGHLVEIPATWVFEMPPEIRDVSDPPFALPPRGRYKPWEVSLDERHQDMNGDSCPILLDELQRDLRGEPRPSLLERAFDGLDDLQTRALQGLDDLLGRWVE